MVYANETSHLLCDNNFWGPVTATLDWCEANYQFSRYIAEAANTVSNLATVVLALWGAQQARAANLPSRYLAGHVGFALVGLGSIIFHATLLYEAQLADELPMIYVAAYCCACLFDLQPGFSLKSGNAAGLTALFFAFNTFFTWSYSVYRNPIYHEVVFAAIMFTIGFRTVHLFYHSPLALKVPSHQKSQVAKTLWSGAGIFAFGFLIWNLDNIFCGTITRWKHQVGWPVAFVLEGHSWWHIFTATGTYLLLIGNTYLTLCIKDDPANYKLGFGFLGLPTLKRATPKVKAQ